MMETLKNNPYYQEALDYIKHTDLNALENGRHLINGENLCVHIVDAQLRSSREAKLEAHNDYIDMQVPLSGPETYGIKPRGECLEVEGEYNPTDDIVFFKDPVTVTVSAEAGETVIFPPDTAHAPLIGEGTIHKAIFKVRVI